MSLNEDRNLVDFPELTMFEKSLAAIVPQPAALDRGALFFQAGEAAAMRAFKNRRPSLRRHGWPAAFAAMTAVAAVLLAALCHREITGPTPLNPGLLPQMAAAPAAPLALPDRASPPESHLAGMLECIRLRDEIVRDGFDARSLEIAVSAEPTVDATRPISSGDLLNQLLREE